MREDGQFIHSKQISEWTSSSEKQLRVSEYEWDIDGCDVTSRLMFASIFMELVETSPPLAIIIVSRARDVF